MDEQLDPNTLDPGIRALVMALRDRGWRTTDSGDGVSKAPEERVFAQPHVVVSLAPDHIVTAARELRLALAEIVGADAVVPCGQRGWTIEATYDPADETAVALISYWDWDVEAVAAAALDSPRSLGGILAANPDRVIETLAGDAQYRARDAEGNLLSATHHADAFNVRIRQEDGTWGDWRYGDIADDDDEYRVLEVAGG